MTSFGLRFSEATQLHNGAWVAALLGTLLGVQDRKNDKFSWAIHLALKGLNIIYGENDFIIIFVISFKICFSLIHRSWGLDEAEVCLLFDGTTQVEDTSNILISKVFKLKTCFGYQSQIIGGYLLTATQTNSKNVIMCSWKVKVPINLSSTELYTWHHLLKIKLWIKQQNAEISNPNKIGALVYHFFVQRYLFCTLY